MVNNKLEFKNLNAFYIKKMEYFEKLLHDLGKYYFFNKINNIIRPILLLEKYNYVNFIVDKLAGKKNCNAEKN